MEKLDLTIDEDYIRFVIGILNTENFGQIQTYIRNSVENRSLSSNEKGIIDRVLHQIRTERAKMERFSNSLVDCGYNVLIVTAYTTDYSIGGLCEKVNRIYAKRYQYEFYAEVLPLEQVSGIISPKKHCTWYKIAVLRKLFDNIELLKCKSIKYVMWIDADAIFADHNVSLQSIIVRAEERDLIIAEDMNTGCLVNAGVFLLRTTEWSRQLLADVWVCDKYDEVCFYEQSALMRCLRARKEGLDTINPFHSYLCGAPQGVKLFPHTAVLPIFDFNSNRGILCNDVAAFQNYAALLRKHADSNTDSGAEPSEQNNANVNADWSYHNTQQQEPGTPKTAADTLPTGTSLPVVVRSACYVREGNYCSLCQRTAGSKWKRDKEAAHRAVAGSSLFIFHPAGMADKLLLLHTAIHKYGVEYDLAADILFAGHREEGEQEVVGATAIKSSSAGCSGGSGKTGGGGGTAPMRLVRGKMGQIPQAGQTHLLQRLNGCK